MANVIRCASDAFGTEAMVYKDVGADRDELYVTFDIYIPQALVDADSADGWVGDICHLTRLNSIITNPAPKGILIDATVPSAPAWIYQDSISTVITTVCPRDVWQTVSIHYLKSDPGGPAVKIGAVDYGATAAETPTDQVDGAAIGMTGPPASIEPLYLRNIKFGSTAYGSSDLFSEAGGSLAGFTSTVGDVTVVDDSTIVAPTPAALSDSLRVGIAFDDGPLEPDPTFTFIDGTDNLVAGYDIQTGKQTELDRTDTGTSTVYLHDTTGDFDPMNTGSPYFGKLVGKQILFQLFDPVTATWEKQWRGKIRDYNYDIVGVLGADGKPIVANIQVECVDIFDYLAGYQVQPGVDGTTPPGGYEGIVFYKDTLEADLLDALGATVDRRIIEGLADGGIDPMRYVVFTGNVAVQDSKYDPGDALLNVLRDAADAEFPGLANIYVDRFGRFVFHGRYARFDPEGVIADGPVSTDTWDFHRWKVGDGTAITGDSDYAQIRVLAYTHGEDDLVNSAVSWPANIDDTLMPGQVFEDATSITNHGKHSLPPMGDLYIREGLTTMNSANVECQKFAEFFVHYLKDPQTRVTSLMVKAIGPDDPRAASTWGVLTRADISDIMRTTVGYPGGTGIDMDNYIEGYVKRVRPLNPTHDYVEVEFNLTPTAWAMDPDGILAPAS